MTEIHSLKQEQRQYRIGTVRYNNIGNAIEDLKGLQMLIKNDNKQIANIDFQEISKKIEAIADKYENNINGSAFFSKTFIEMLKHVGELIKSLFKDTQLNEPQTRKDGFVASLQKEETKLKGMQFQF